MRIRPHVWIGIFSGLAVISVAVVDVTRTSPGPLISPHQASAELTGHFGCASCHGGLTSSMRDSCLACHESIAGQLQIQGGLHGSLDPDQAGQCALCHSDHHGSGFQSVNPQSFVQAGFSAPPTAFEHGRIGFDISGAHDALACSECHEFAEAPALGDGQVRFLGLAPHCSSCHEDPHEGQMLRSCLDCHDQLDFATPDAFEHDRWLPLAGGHGELDCRTCHAQGEPHSLEAWGSSQAPRLSRGAAFGTPTARECADCHESPHADPFVVGVAALVELSSAGSCAACHPSEHQGFAERTEQLTPRQHASSGFPLRQPHDELECSACHLDSSHAFDERFPGRTAEACEVCHSDPHAGQFAESNSFAGGCLDCHARQSFAPPVFGLEQHAHTELPLTGAHEQSDCRDCHTRLDGQGVREFHGTSARCADCHTDAHLGYFEPEPLPESATRPERQAARLARLEQETCERCHTTSSFRELEAAFEHEAWTGFELVGAHQQAACESCHTRSELADEHGRTFGRAGELFGEFTELQHGETCALCHADPHAGDFDKRGLPKRPKGRSGCARCHSEVSFRALPFGFDHGRWTGFELEDAHAEADCAACHIPLRHADELGRTWSRSNGSSCAECHQDPHAGQFVVDDVNDCARCHQSAQSFTKLAFRHVDTRFPLDETHVELACAACHQPAPELEGQAVRYTPLGTTCVDCHGTQEGPRRRRKRR